MRRNHTRSYKQRKRTILDKLDRDVVFRPDLPEIKYIVNYARKTIFTNMEAAPWATGVKRVGYQDGA